MTISVRSPSIRPRLWLALSGLSGAVAVASEAFARHGLDPTTDAHTIERITIASKYQGLHALALIAALILADRFSAGLSRRATIIAGWAFALGLLLFCGTLDALAAGAPQSLTAIVPFGGTLFILGWLSLALAGVAGTFGRLDS